MRLSKLTIFGFKSFADKLEITFGTGLTSVVGPNGCGKTNVVDAIKWVMGEQKPTAIRGKSMEDVIFNGSSSRKPLGFAEVSLTIENTENLLPVDVPEVTVTRRLFRSGESEYLLNRQPCRMRDIHDLFMDSGISHNSYSVIQQEMVDLIISEKAEERRNLFEEAAGIQKYKSRRRETLNKLRGTEQDLLRLGDVVGEVEKAVRSLNRQVNRAKRYQRYRERLSNAEVHLAALRDRRIEEEMKPLRDELRTLRESRQGVGTDLARHEAEVAEARAREVELEQDLAGRQQEVDRAREQVQQVEGELIALRERLTAAAGTAERSRREAAEMEQRRVEALQEHQRLIGEREQALQQHVSVEAREAEQEQQLAAIEARLQQAQEQLHQVQERHGRASNYYQDEAQRAEFLQFKAGERRKRIEGLQQQQQQAHQGAVAAEAEREALEQALTEAVRRRDQARGQRRQAETARDEAAEAWQQINGRCAEAAGAVKAALAERDVIRGLLQRLEGVDETVRDLRQDEQVGRGGLLAERLEVAPEAVAAVEAVLGTALEGLLVADQGMLAQALDRLQARPQGGRAVLLAPHLAAPRPPTADLPPWAGTDPAVRGRLADQVGAEGAAGAVARALLDRALWVEDLPGALALAPRADQAGYTLATRQGEVVAPGGMVRVGRASQQQAAGLLSRRRQLEELEASVQRQTRRLEESERERDRGQQAVEQARRRAVETTEQLEQAEQQTVEIERRLGAAQSRHDALQERANELERRITDEGEELAADVAEMEKLSPLLTRALEESGRLGGQMEEQRMAVEQINAERDQKRIEQQEGRLARVRAEHRLEGLEREIARLEQTAAELAEGITRRQEEAAAADEHRRTLEQRMADRQQVLEEYREIRVGLEEDLAERERLHLEHRNRLHEVEEALRKERRAREDQQERIHAVELRLSELGMRRENLAERIREEYDVVLQGVDPDALVAEGEDPPTYEHLEEEVHTLRQRLEQIGPVNLLALEEYEAEKTRLDFLTTQRRDLEEAREALEQTIRKINKTARQRFLATFEAIRENFRRTYTQFFEGGEADIYLGGEGDPLEGRIEIVARPKGKILKSMAALSGGEKALTAVALLFAIYLVKPSPFCILDEVDAPLDEANIQRFLRVIKSFGKTTQFILITHNKRTMEASDTFLGITMEEPGVSKVVGVRFSGEEAAA